MPTKRKSLTFAERLESERVNLDMSRSQFAFYLNSGYSSLQRWSKGKVTPRDHKIVDIGMRLEWPDEVIISYLKNIPEAGILRELILRLLFLGVKQNLLIDYLDISKTTYENWRDRGYIVPYEAATKMVHLMTLGDNGLMAELGHADNDRGELDMALVKELEAEYGQLDKVPEDNPKLAMLRKLLKVKL